MKEAYQNVGLTTLTIEGNVASLDGKITLQDNFNQHIDLGSADSQRFRNRTVKVNGITIFLFCIEGTIDVRLAFKDYQLKKNDIFIVQNGQIGDFGGMSPDAKFFIIFVHNDFTNPLTRINDSVKLQDLLFRGPYHHCTDAEMDAFLHLYRYTRTTINTDYPYKEEIIKGYVYTILYSIYSLSFAEAKQQESKEDQTKQANEGGVGRAMAIYKQFLEEVQEHFAQEHKMQFYADRLCITQKYLSHMVYKASGRFAKDYIRDALIMESKALLKGGYTIQSICDRLNFNSPSFFGRFFKEATGFTPFEYQQRG